jgi:hypothetical protein
VRQAYGDSGGFGDRNTKAIMPAGVLRVFSDRNIALSEAINVFSIGGTDRWSVADGISKTSGLFDTRP